MKYAGSCHCGQIKFEAEGTAPNGDATAAINLRCLDNIDLAAIPVHHYDGRAA